MKSVFGILAMIALIGLSACKPADKTPAAEPAKSAATPASTNLQIFQVTGIVQKLETNGTTVVIKHEEIPGYMAKMTMPFEVKDTNELRDVFPGDHVSFRMLVTDDDGWIDQVTVYLRTNAPAGAPAYEFTRQVRMVEPLEVGDVLPDYPMTNELGQAISLGQFKGQALAFTFIFTRCPFPNFCPRMASNFSDTYKQLKADTNAPTNWHLLSISFDVTFDTPKTLKSYAQRYKYDPEKWNYATGALIEIDALTEQFGLVFARDEGNMINFNHNLRTVVVDTTGKIHKILIGNEWKPEELTEAIKAAAQVKP